jgi:hypothetical protein
MLTAQGRGAELPDNLAGLSVVTQGPKRASGGTE